MKTTRRIVAGLAAVGLSIVSVTGMAHAAPSPSPKPTKSVALDPVAQALKAAQAAMAVPTRILQTVPLKTAPAKTGRIIFINNGNGPTQVIASGVEEATKSIGWEYESVGYNTANPATLQQALQNALAKSPTAVVIAGAQADVISQAVKQQYLAAKVPIVLGSACPVKTEAPIFAGAALCPNGIPMGKALANWAIADSKGTAKIILQSMPVYTVYIPFREAFEAELKAKCPKCEVQVVETTLAQFAANQIPSLMVNKLRTDPSYKYLFFDNAAWSKGVVPALAAAGLLESTKVGGQAIDETALSALRAGQNVVWTANSFKLYGYANVDSVLRVMTKSSGIDKNATSPMQLITTVNAGSVTLPYLEPSSALAQYKRLWKVR